jgi:DNA modification methylase
MNIIYKPISELIPYVNNPRKNDKAVDAVASSIKNFGFKNPIIIDGNNEIVAGHTRLKAAKKLGIASVPCIIADDLTPSQIKAFRIADNRVSEQSHWDLDLLAIELDGLNEFTGFDENSFKMELKKAEEDEFNAELTDSVVKLGDIWELGNHRLMCGDSTNSKDVSKLMINKARILFTSPPYSDIRDYNGEKDLSIKNLIKFIECYKKYTDYQIINLGIQRKNHELIEYWNDYIEKSKEVGYKFLSWNVWNKIESGSIGQSSAMFAINHEWIFVFGIDSYELNLTVEKKKESIKKGGLRTVRQKDGSTKYSSKGDTMKKFKKMMTVQTILYELGENRKNHPAPFPIELPFEYIQAMTDENDIIIEPFAGSGTTILASEQLNRRCYAMELDEKFCDVIIRRWEQYTGKKAIKCES